MRVAICGATGGIGSALARLYAAPNHHLYLSGRNLGRLATLSLDCEARGATVSTASFDLRDQASLSAWVHEIVGADGALDLVVFCAGVSSSVFYQDGRLHPETQKDIVRTLEVNALTNIFGANLAATLMLERKKPHQHCQICLISSLLAHVGLPGSPAYAASKAAVLRFGLALRRLLSDQNIGVTVIVPGLIASPMSDRYQGAKPLMVSADQAALKIRKALSANRATLTFPKILRFGMFLLEMLPERLQQPFLKAFFFTVAPDEESQQQKK